ncbi:glycosyltransferase family 2 protein [Ohtaekwangia koreensis]|uniref:Dolichol-phosphate mannosyltransferase n=1 Tax=Ohtaekwangia koreensis TaxID=688867 RepID=A0A1T5IXA5_9BACT|nr:glycosyltransferase family 2 protein [Ohtaekwangia koreensis]SKC43800.1 dolichol-phosphate mannosyltransferase [Ohtaekwangia koreensis]
MISIVIPVYMGKDSLVELYQRLRDTIENKLAEDFEILFVNDQCPQNSWELISKIAQSDNRVKGINLSRNFGQHYAISAGLESCKGEWVVVMDCDLQDQPEEIVKLFEKTKENYQIIFAKREARKDTFFKRISSKVFYSLFGYLTETKQDSSIANFGIYHRKAIDAVVNMKDQIRYFPAMIQWVGFSKTSIMVEHSERKHGETSYSWNKLIKLALNTIISFSDKPLRLTIKLGLVISLISSLLGIYTLIRYIAGSIEVVGYTSLILSIWFLCGLIIMILGMLGLYLGKAFEKVKDRPIFIVKDTINI